MSAAPEPRELPACIECGACCHSDDPGWLPVFEIDRERLGSLAEEVLVRRGERWYLRLARGRCVGLRSRGGRHECDWYERRPDVCRALARGSAECRAALRRSAR